MRLHQNLSSVEGVWQNAKSLFILKYVDDPALRQSIEKQLNKVEGSYTFAKTISFGPNSGYLAVFQPAWGIRFLGRQNGGFDWTHRLQKFVGTEELRMREMSKGQKNGL